jgi:uncharacterized protein (TIGR02646 family)
MRKLDRTTVPTPACLSNYQHGANTWNDVTSSHKRDVRDCLEQLQGRRCAYCEGALDVLGQHIEHFRRKHHHPHLTFSWTNLYWSCDQSDSCGHYKDHGAGTYSPNDLLEPCVDDPDRFFRFRSDGTVQVRPGLTPQEEHRARETLRVFNLHADFGRLRNMRKGAAATYLGLLNDLVGLTDLERRDYVQLELQASAGEPFFTLVRHLFEDLL